MSNVAPVSAVLVIRWTASAATRESRPDWDLSTPGLLEAWAAGDWSRFHGWDQRAADRDVVS